MSILLRIPILGAWQGMLTHTLFRKRGTGLVGSWKAWLPVYFCMMLDKLLYLSGLPSKINRRD